MSLGVVVLGYAEVYQHHIVAAVILSAQQEIGWLHIQMHRLTRMKIRQSLTRLVDQIDGTGYG